MPPFGTRRAPRFVVLALLSIVTLFVSAACTTTVQGHGSYGNGIKGSTTPSDLKIEGSDGGEIDQLVANSLSDIFAYWKGEFPKQFGKKWTPLKGGIHSYTPTQNEKVPCVSSAKDGANNAFYCPSADLIAYDRDFLKQLADQYGKFIVPLILAHEYGHAIQFRIGDPSDKSIVLETQADCFAGVFVEAANKGTEHFNVTTKDLDTVMAGYLLFRDEPGGSSQAQGSHGSGFDRVSAFQEGYTEGEKKCANDFNDKRVFTEIPYTSSNDAGNQGNSPYTDILDVGPKEFNLYFDALLSSMPKNWDEVEATPFDGTSGQCNAKTQKQLIFYCASDKMVYYSPALTKKAYDNFGDYAVVQLMGIAYSDAALDKIGSKTTGADRLKRQLCLSGTFAGDAFRLTAEGKSTLGSNTLSAGDLDEAIAVLIAVGSSNAVIDTHVTDAFDRIDAFRKGVLDAVDNGPTAEKCLS